MTERRTLLKRLAGLLGGIIGAGLIAPAALYLLDPVRRRSQREVVPPLPLGRLDEVPDLDRGERPLRQTVVARNVRDAWNRFPEVRLGSVWLYRRGSDLVCLSTICPHAGCSIDYDDQRDLFTCPCHRSTFALDGTRREGPSPRDMDRLEVEVKQGQVLCRYRRFRLAVSTQEPV